MGDELEIFVNKASLKPDALKGLHLPVVPTCGYVEELYMHVTTMAAAFKFLKKNREPNRIKNMMLLLEPGPGIQDGYVWDPEYVQKAKNHLVDLLSQRLTVRKPNKSDALRSEFNEKMFKDLVWYFTVDVQCLRCHQRLTCGPRMFRCFSWSCTQKSLARVSFRVDLPEVCLCEEDAA